MGAEFQHSLLQWMGYDPPVRKIKLSHLDHYSKSLKRARFGWRWWVRFG